MADWSSHCYSVPHTYIDHKKDKGNIPKIGIVICYKTNTSFLYPINLLNIYCSIATYKHTRHSVMRIIGKAS